MFAEAMTAPGSPLVSYYGAIVGLNELGAEVQKVFILPHLRAISERVDAANDPAAPPPPAGTPGGANIERIAAHHIRQMVVKNVSQAVKACRTPPDQLEEYKKDYGSLGNSLHAFVTRLRTKDLQQQQQQQQQQHQQQARQAQRVVLLQQSKPMP